jgi:hypothetical protein
MLQSFVAELLQLMSWWCFPLVELERSLWWLPHWFDSVECLLTQKYLVQWWQSKLAQ